ncbi:OmpA family protein [Intestinibacter sp.]|uniref:OmpA family protein n=1 Tax=Intestinibacter sp. TaxID=1965304 RepID=UPI003F152D70
MITLLSLIIPIAIHFGFNSSNIEEYQKLNIENIAIYLKDNPDCKLYIIGYSDLVENSDKLSENRAKNVKRELIKLGARDNQLITVEEGIRVQNYERNNWNRVVIITD